MTRTSRGYWRVGDDVGHRLFATLHGDADGAFHFESGESLSNVTVAYETWGTLNSDASNAVLVEHALTGDSHVSGPSGPGHPTKGWWDGLVGPGLAIDTTRFFVVCANVLGGSQGTTGPSSLNTSGRPFGSSFPRITIRDQVKIEVRLATHIGIDEWHAIVGGSMGAMRALEWAVGYPSRVKKLVLLAVGAASNADQIALSSLQVRAIKADPLYFGGDYYDKGVGPRDGLAIARGIGHLTYRSSGELDSRFGRNVQGQEDPLKGGRYAIESYLEHQGEKLAARFDANSYVVLSEAMNLHDVGRHRGGVESALSKIRADTIIIGISSDRLYPLVLQEELAEKIPGAHSLVVVSSIVGHDGFLLEIDQIEKIVGPALRDERR